MIFGFLDVKTIYTIFHLIGVAFGAGGAYISGFLFLSAIRDGNVSMEDIKALKVGSKAIWVGILILVASGALLFFLDPDKYLNSSKFLAKMTIVAVIIANGILYHLYHIPKLAREKDTQFTFSNNKKIFLSGAITFASWTFALALGSIKAIPYSYFAILSAYGIFLLLSIAGIFALRKFLCPAPRQ